MNLETIVTSAITSIIVSIYIFYVKNCYTAFVIRKRVAKALFVEIDTLFELYKLKRQDGMSFSFKECPTGTDNKTKYIQGIMNIDHSCFVVYDHNSDKLGYFDTDEITAIVKLYTLARGHLCSIDTWNNMSNMTDDIHEFKRYKETLDDEYSMIEEQVEVTKECLQKIINKNFKEEIKSMWIILVPSICVLTLIIVLFWNAIESVLRLAISSE